MRSFINEKHLFLLEEVVRKNFSSKYKDSYLGILWSVLNPLLMVLVLTAVFSTILGRGIENYPVYLLSGRCIFSFFMGTVGSSMNVLKSNRNILKKTASPKYIFVLGNIISEFLNFIISFGLLIVVMIVTQATFHFSTMIFFFIPVICITIMIIGGSLAMSIVTVYYTDVKHLWGVFSQIMLYTCAIFYQMDAIPEPYHKYLILNPLYWAIEQFRDLMVFGVMPDALNMLNLFIIALMILTIGAIIFIKYEDNVTLRF